MRGKKEEKNSPVVGTRCGVKFKKRSLGKKPVLLKDSLDIKAELLLVTNKKLVSHGSR